MPPPLEIVKQKNPLQTWPEIVFQEMMYISMYFVVDLDTNEGHDDLVYLFFMKVRFPSNCRISHLSMETHCKN